MNFPKYPYQPFDEPIPAPSSDLGALCLQIDAKWKPYLVGLLKTLLISRTWESDEIRATGEASLLLDEILNAEFCVREIGGIAWEEDMGCCIRWNNGVLEVFTCGEWTPVPGSSGGQPGPAGVVIPTDEGQPAPGECREYNLLVNSTLQTLLPMQVSTGDSIEVTEVKGAWSDSFPDPLTAFWYCGKGEIFALGFCSGAQHTEGGDPDPTSPHMCVIGEVGGIAQFFAAYPGLTPYIVPPGVTNENVYFQANDGTPGDNQGSVSIHVKVCTGSAVAINLTGLGGGSAPAASLSRNSINIGDTFFVTPHFNPGNGKYDGGFSADQLGTWQIVSLSNAIMPGNPCDWEWSTSHSCHSGNPAIPSTSPSGEVGWFGNSNTEPTIGFKLLSVP